MALRTNPWVKPLTYIALASFSCLLFSAFTPPLLTPEVAARLPIIGSLPGDLPGYSVRFILSFLLLGVAPGILAAMFRESGADLGINFRTPILRKFWFWLLVPVAAAIGAIGALSPDLGSFYPYSHELINLVNKSGFDVLFGHFIAYFFFYYIPWEFFFRGFLIFPFALAAEKAFGAQNLQNSSNIVYDNNKTSETGKMVLAALVLFQTIPSTMMHFGHPLSELVSAVVAGILFGIVAWRTRSIIPGLILHTAIGFGTDLLIVLKATGYLQ